MKVSRAGDSCSIPEEGAERPFLQDKTHGRLHHLQMTGEGEAMLTETAERPKKETIMRRESGSMRTILQAR